MKSRITVEELLRWRLARGEAEAPPPPRAARLLELARPWWENWPERFQTLVQRLHHLEIFYGYAMAESRRAQCEHPVPTLVAQGTTEIETSTRILYISVRDGQLRLRLQLAAAQQSSEAAYEATFICRLTSRPLFSASALHSTNNEYSLTQELTEELAREWDELKVTDEMPFRLILRPLESAG